MLKMRQLSNRNGAYMTTILGKQISFEMTGDRPRK